MAQQEASTAIHQDVDAEVAAVSATKKMTIPVPKSGTASSRVSTALPSSRSSATKAVVRSETASTWASASPASARDIVRPPSSAPRSKHRRTTVRDRFGGLGAVSSAPRRGAATKSALLKEKDSQKKTELASKASQQWALVRKAVHATRFWKRMALMSENVVGDGQKLDLGTMKQFVGDRKLKDINWRDDSEMDLLQLRAAMKKVHEEEDMASAAAAGQRAESQPLKPHGPKPLSLQGRRRREVPLVGNSLSQFRQASERHQQLRAMLPRLNDGLASPESPPQLRPSTAPAPPACPKASVGHLLRLDHQLADGREDYHLHTSSFTLSLLSSAVSKPRAEIHPLLSAIEGMQEEDVHVRDPEAEFAAMAQRLDELRWGEKRRGPWTAPPERRKLLVEDARSTKQQARQERELRFHSHEAPKHPMAGSPAMQAGMDCLLRLMDPDSTGVVSAEVFVPLMFWLALTRRRSAALLTTELAFGSGKIDVAVLKRLTPYLEVQLRLIEGLRQLARLESLEQLCEFITDWPRLRTWFYTMKRDTTGQADIVEVQSLFARMEVTSDRQALFRFLSHFAKSELTPAEAGLQTRTFGIADFAKMLCRCAVAWTLHRTLVLINPDACGSGEDGTGPFHVPLGVKDPDREAQLRWTQLQRKIIVSLLVNHRFWGRESRTVLASLNQPALATFGHQLTPEQWLSLFQRVRAQGIASTLPRGDEVDDPDFLVKKAVRVQNINVKKEY